MKKHIIKMTLTMYVDATDEIASDNMAWDLVETWHQVTPPVIEWDNTEIQTWAIEGDAK